MFIGYTAGVFLI